ncbi:MAG: hypothetical protein C4308_09625 [Chitinophagaceae bacterium]
MPVNWVDGMKISRRHFQQQDGFTNEAIQDALAVQINPFNFGILPAEHALKMEVQCDFSQQIFVQVTHCNAVTPNGSRIYIIPSFDINTVTHFKEIAEQYGLQLAQPQTLLILLSVNPFDRVPYGEPAVDENPPRHPFTRPNTKLDILPVDQIKTLYLGNILVIGKISYINGELIYQREYIPPCASISSLPIVKEWYNRFQNSLNSIEHSCFKIIEKIRAKGQTNVLTNGIGKIVDKFAYEIANTKTYFRWLVPYAPPVHMCEVLSRLLHLLNATLLTFSPSDKEEVINYFSEWTDMVQGNIERQLNQALQAPYEHYDLQKTFGTIFQAYSTYQQIFEKLVQLEYIGKHKGDSKIYIEQKVEMPSVTGVKPAEKASKWSPLD